MKTELLLTLELDDKETEAYREYGLEFILACIGSRTIDCKRLKKIDHVNDYLSSQGEGAIIWSVDDFEGQAYELELRSNRPYGSMYDRSKFSSALKSMIDDQDADHGINWGTVEWYLDEYCRIEDCQSLSPYTLTLTKAEIEVIELMVTQSPWARLLLSNVKDNVLTLSEDDCASVQSYLDIWREAVGEISNTSVLHGLLFYLETGERWSED